MERLPVKMGACTRLLKRLRLTDAYAQQVEADYERMQAPEYAKLAREAEKSLPPMPRFRRFVGGKTPPAG